MALVNTLEPAQAGAALAEWLRARIPGAADVEVTDVEIPKSAGLSMMTILFKARWQGGDERNELDLVARVEPSGPGMPKKPDVAREYALLAALGEHTDIAVPRVRWLEEDPGVLGSPFMVVDRAYGDVPADDPPYVAAGWVVDLAPEDRAKLYDRALEVIKQIQDVDWQAAGLSFLDEPEFGPPGLDQQIAHWEDYYEWARAGGAGTTTIDAAFDWAKANRPADDRLVLAWGDPRIGNIIYGDDLSVQAVLDWESAAIAPPGLDLGWFLFFVRYYHEGLGLPVPDGLQSRPELIARYEELTGRTADDVDFWEAFAGLRLSILMMRAGRLMIELGALPPDNPMPVSNPASQLLATLLGLQAPGEEAGNFIGNR